MREIKFRGLCNEEVHTHHEATELGEFVYGYLVNPYTIRTTMSQESGGMGSGFVEVDVEVIPETVGQFTGLKDKNGVDIYEGDVDEGGYVCIYSKSLCCYAFSTEQGMGGFYKLNFETHNEIEVIGNVHENKSK